MVNSWQTRIDYRDGILRATTALVSSSILSSTSRSKAAFHRMKKLPLQFCLIVITVNSEFQTCGEFLEK
jgi:hypothetical protein